MAADLTTLEARRDALKSALTSGTQSVSYGNYHKTFRSVADLREAIADVESDISQITGTSFVRTYRFHSRKGL